jgi:RNA recognition motif-containing protein
MNNSVNTRSAVTSYDPTSQSSSDLSDSLSFAENKAATVFVGRLPRRTSAKVVADFFSSAGAIRRVLFSKETYLFVEFEAAESADRAVQMFNGQLFNSNSIIVQPSLSLKKLFVGNIKKTLIAQVIFDHIAKIESGLSCVELFEVAEAQATDSGDNRASDAVNSSSSGGGGTTTFTRGQARTNTTARAGTAANQLHHRGFCFAEFEDHESAHRALIALNTRSSSSTSSSGAAGASSGTEKSESVIQAAVLALSESSFRGDNEIRVDWAEPLHEVAPAVMDTVRILYVSNLPPSHSLASEHTLFDLFSSVGDADQGPCVEHVKRIKNFAFVHFKTRQDAELALKKFQGHVIAGHAIKVQWSKPPPRPSRDQFDTNASDSGFNHGNGQQRHQQMMPLHLSNPSLSMNDEIGYMMGASPPLPPSPFPITSQIGGAALAFQQQYARNQQHQLFLQQRQQQLFQMQLRQQQAALQQQFEVVAQQQAAMLAQQQAALMQAMGMQGMQGLPMIQIPMMQPFMMEAPYGLFPQHAGGEVLGENGVVVDGSGQPVGGLVQNFAGMTIGGPEGAVDGVGRLVDSSHGSGDFSGSVVASDLETEASKNNLQPSGEVGLDLSASPLPPVSPRALSLQKSPGSSIASGGSTITGGISPFIGSRASSQTSSQHSSPRNGQVATVHLPPNAMQGMHHEHGRSSVQGGLRQRPAPPVHNAQSQPRGGGGGGGGSVQAPYINGSKHPLGAPVQAASLPSLLTPSGSTNSLSGAAASGSNKLKVVDSYTDLMGSISDAVRTR